MRIATFSAALVLFLYSAGVSADGNAQPTTHTVTMAGVHFHPEELTVALGDTVVWSNDDLVAHTATSRAGHFDSKKIEPGKSWSYTVTKKGDFPYVCIYHRGMKATLHVQ
jgi:plastocyanin